MLGGPGLPTSQAGIAFGAGACPLDVFEPAGAVSLDPHPEQNATATPAAARSAGTVRLLLPLNTVMVSSLGWRWMSPGYSHPTHNSAVDLGSFFAAPDAVLADNGLSATSLSESVISYQR
jgi:hypothetical protein